MPPDSERISEYTSVILRQSARLKKLTEDLVEASKASTGNVEVNAEVLDVSELLSQSVGEFADRFDAAGLTPVETKPSAPVHIFADALGTFLLSSDYSSAHRNDCTGNGTYVLCY